MNYTGRTLLAAMTALTLLGAGGGAALADDKHGPDSSHGDAGKDSSDRDGVCDFITNEPSDDPDDASGDPGNALNVLPVDDADANADVPVQRPDFNDPDCQDQFGMDPGNGVNQPDACDNLVLPIGDIPDFMGCEPDEDEDPVNAQ